MALSANKQEQLIEGDCGNVDYAVGGAVVEEKFVVFDYVAAKHDVGKKVISDIDASSSDDVKLAKVKVLSETIDPHIKEEESDIFKKAKKVLSDDDELEIGRLFETEKRAKM